MLNFIQSVILTIVLIPVLTLIGLLAGLTLALGISKMSFMLGLRETTRSIQEATNYIKNCIRE